VGRDEGFYGTPLDETVNSWVRWDLLENRRKNLPL
jgi:hypothetical protein